jgi:diguanylate cyclase (GGDEF)-like protein
MNGAVSVQQLQIMNIGIDIFCLLELSILFVYLHKNMLAALEYHFFRRVIFFMFLALSGDALSWIVNGQSGPYITVINYFANFLYMTSQLFAAMSIYLFFYLICYDRQPDKKLRILAFDLPFLLILVFTYTTPWTGLVFTIDAQNLYQRGILLPYFSMATLAYIFAGSLTCAHQIPQEVLQDRKKRLKVLALYVIPVILGSVIQTSFYGISLVLPCSVLAITMIFLNEQYLRISVDSLTGLNNRGCFDRYLYNQLDSENKKDLVLIMLDINNFKAINDAFGHIKGDFALRSVADVLRHSSASKNVFLARYGGDEFAYILHREEVTVEEVMKDIHDGLEAFNKTGQLPMKLSVAMGYAVYEEKEASAPDLLIKKADAMMYQNKASMKTNTNEAAVNKKTSLFWGQNKKD